MLAARLLRELTLGAGAGAPHVSAASGLVEVGSRLYVVADDELHLAEFARDGDAPGRVHRLFDGALPDEHAARKRAKPDLEILLRLPPHAGCVHGALLALPSGSKPHRTRGALLALDVDGSVHGTARAIDFAPLYRRLDAELPRLNLEGALLDGDDWLLLQRANRKHPSNALLRVPCAVLDASLAARALPEFAVAVTPVDLGCHAGVPLGLTDATRLEDGRIAFCAAAEDTDDAYLDGRCAAAAVGVLARDGGIERLELLAGGVKPEGIVARHVDGALELLLVTDADDRAQPAQLLAVTLSLR